MMIFTFERLRRNILRDGIEVGRTESVRPLRTGRLFPELDLFIPRQGVRARLLVSPRRLGVGGRGATRGGGEHARVVVGSRHRVREAFAL